MQVNIFAVGRMKTGPEAELVSRYLDRLAKSGRALGIEFGGVAEVPESRAQAAQQRKTEESARCLDSVRDTAAVLVLLDERGKSFTSRKFAEFIARHRDSGAGRIVFALGGPDGHDPALRERADCVMSFGEQTWPHQLARIMLAEQLYRATTILAGHPYHRD